MVFPFAGKMERDSTERYLKEVRLKNAFRNTLTNQTEGEWLSAFWPMQLMQYTSPDTDRKMAEA